MAIHRSNFKLDTITTHNFGNLQLLTVAKTMVNFKVFHAKIKHASPFSYRHMQ